MTTSDAIKGLHSVAQPHLNTELYEAFSKMVYKLNKALTALMNGNTSTYQYEIGKVNNLIQEIDKYMVRGLNGQGVPSNGKPATTISGDVLKNYDDVVAAFFQNHPRYVACRSYKYLYDGEGLRYSTIDSELKKEARALVQANQPAQATP